MIVVCDFRSIFHSQSRCESTTSGHSIASPACNRIPRHFIEMLWTFTYRKRSRQLAGMDGRAGGPRCFEPKRSQCSSLLASVKASRWANTRGLFRWFQSYMLALLAPRSARVVSEGVSENTVCPYSGGAISHLIEVEGRVFGFCNAGCRDKTLVDSDAFPAFSALLAK